MVILYIFSILVVILTKTLLIMDKTNIEVEMKGSSVPKMSFKQRIIAFGGLGKEIKLSPKSHLVLNKAGFSVEYYVETVSVCIGIGNDHTAKLVMSVDAWNALNAGAVVSVDTAKEFESKFGS